MNDHLFNLWTAWVIFSLFFVAVGVLGGLIAFALNFRQRYQYASYKWWLVAFFGTISFLIAVGVFYSASPGIMGTL